MLSNAKIERVAEKSSMVIHSINNKLARGRLSMLALIPTHYLALTATCNAVYILYTGRRFPVFSLQAVRSAEYYIFFFYCDLCSLCILLFAAIWRIK